MDKYRANGTASGTITLFQYSRKNTGSPSSQAATSPISPTATSLPASSAKLEAELQQHVRGKLAPYEYPKEIEFIDSLPMTTTGKVQRRVLRMREEEKKGKGQA